MSSVRVPVSFALPRFDHAAEIFSGRVELAGIEARFLSGADAAAAEEGPDVVHMSLADYVRAEASGGSAHRAIPVFPSRAFIHSWLYRSSGEGAQSFVVGGGEPTATAAIYAQGMLADAGQSSDGIVIDATPDPRERLTPLVERPGPVEREYFANTGVFPILGALAIKVELIEANRWLATNVFRAFEVSRRRYFARLVDIRGSRVPIPSVAAHVLRLRALLGPDLWPYGVAQNRTTLESFARYAAAAGLIGSIPGDVADWFAPVEPFVDYTDGI